MMKSIVFAIALLVVPFVGTSQADIINNNLGVYTELGSLTSGPAHSSTQFIFVNGQEATTDSEYGAQNLQRLVFTNALSGEDGLALANAGGMTILGQNIGPNTIVQYAFLEAEINTAVSGNGAASATYAESNSQVALNMGSFAVDGMIFVGTSFSATLPVFGTPGGTAISSASVNAVNTSVVVD